MEDAHAVFPRDDWGFFGVFDGHCGPLCSEYVAKRFEELLEQEDSSISDEKLKDLALAIDMEFLSKGEEGGSTGTFMKAQKKEGGKYIIQVGNVGDSRVILGRRAKRVSVSMTEDHKPTLPNERQRIHEADGTVTNCRVDGSLAVSRAFGDAQYKNKGTYDSKVIAVPEFSREECEEGDIVLLCCDGVFESGVFCNASVIDFIFERLDKKMDLANIAAEVCEEAMHRGSKDNISAMIVQLGGVLDCQDKYPEKEVLAGPCSMPSNEKFITAYLAMAEKGGLDLPRCVDLRYDQARVQLSQLKDTTKCNGRTCDFSELSRTDLQRLVGKVQPGMHERDSEIELIEILREMEARLQHDETLDLRPIDVQDIEMELAAFGLPETLASQKSGTDERVSWFKEWLDKQKEETIETENDEIIKRVTEIQQQVGLPASILLNLLRSRGGV
eukprot:TRINITY_DN2404_c0_g1_i2.p1 TRINITY_DN2404_c0_g1~~TRINITY_DN2404_c0_g1_i2.p1  ORF type:complete len:496 (+),score=186.48 TRINITY_DN2404_c0_g1_i2:161-1489(+)